MSDSPQVQKKIELLFQVVKGSLPLQTYAILDAARDKVIYKKILNGGILEKCLFHGAKAAELAPVAPYLVHLKQNDLFTEWLLTQGWGNSWGVFLQAPETLKLNELQRHFRKFLMVYNEDGKPLYFRFYDPRVLRVYLPTCNAKDLEIIFGPVKRFYAEGEEENLLREYACTPKYQLIENELSL